MQSKRIIILGLFLVLFGFFAPFLMIIGILESTFLLNFFSYFASIAGLLIGIIWAAGYVRAKRN